ncbi:MAG TPA: hypothetical protein P5539_09890 [Mesotoga sp.]|nr:hypothetical protein [Mesotoga sp.]
MIVQYRSLTKNAPVIRKVDSSNVSMQINSKSVKTHNHKVTTNQYLTPNVVLSDVTHTDTGEKLFYKHELKLDGVLTRTLAMNLVTLTDQNKQPVSRQLYDIQIVNSKPVLFSNLRNTDAAQYFVVKRNATNNSISRELYCAKPVKLPLKDVPVADGSFDGYYSTKNLIDDTNMVYSLSENIVVVQPDFSQIPWFESNYEHFTCSLTAARRVSENVFSTGLMFVSSFSNGGVKSEECSFDGYLYIRSTEEALDVVVYLDVYGFPIVCQAIEEPYLLEFSLNRFETTRSSEYSGDFSNVIAAITTEFYNREEEMVKRDDSDFEIGVVEDADRGDVLENGVFDVSRFDSNYDTGSACICVITDDSEINAAKELIKNDNNPVFAFLPAGTSMVFVDKNLNDVASIESVKTSERLRLVNRVNADTGDGSTGTSLRINESIRIVLED